MRILNYSHPLTEDQQSQIKQMTGADSLEITTIPVSINGPLAEQVVELVDQAGLTPEQWQTEKVAIRLPGLAEAAACLLAEIHGRSGYFPTIINIRQSSQAGFVVKEVVDLQTLRSEARTRRFSVTE